MLKNLFSYDGFIVRSVNKLTDIVLLSLLWLIACLPIFTFGAASAALYYTVYKVILSEDGHIWKTFWHAFRENFRQATPVGLLLTGIYYLLIVSFYAMFLLYGAGRVSKWTFLMPLIPTILVTMWSVYLLPSIARFENRTTIIFKNCLLFAVLNGIPSFLTACLLLAAWALFVYAPVSVIFLPVAYTYFSSFLIEKVFGNYIPQEKGTSHDPS